MSPFLSYRQVVDMLGKAFREGMASLPLGEKMSLTKEWLILTNKAQKIARSTFLGKISKDNEP